MCRTPEERIERVASLLPNSLTDQEKKEAAKELNVLALLLAQMRSYSR
jgi:hypothetical protein